VRPNLLQPLQILTKLALHSVCQYLRVFTIDNIALSVEEPGWDFVLCRILNNGDDSLKFFRCDFTSTIHLSGLSRFGGEGLFCAPFVQVNIGLFADQVGVSPAHPFDLG
jgi:hypothetical protein